MSVQKIRSIPDPVLRFKAKKVHRQSKQYLDELTKDLLDTIRATNGLGLAAPQIGVGLRVIVYDTSPGNQLYRVLVNPEIPLTGPDEEIGTEGCLSMPGFLANIKRFKTVSVRHDHGAIHCSGLNARIIQHEIDHLDGILIIDKAIDPEKEKLGIISPNML